ncbi:polyisoprenoid-binding protein YceI [Branchiibius hedensis]|uniref:Polyisoprenoid-binding protein YceI n=1 Tax=Branchiibius hedensis TaxID=672460 RepID=A0A2Y8ZKC7_9MICO|nr:YceI family protein [Branchiibius hedensis]PWJ24032.1 polyisoprenoid-binding protein YceI [Branchiibius hedensis]SSA32850.1 Polyisoprenoid-binding protein YceI [Branchiibius hedensis]
MTTLKDLTPGVWTVDPSHSTVGFLARHLMVSKVRGSFTEFTADVKIGEQFEDSTVSATVQLASVSTGSEDRDGHLKSPDFFDVENNPTMTFTSTKVTPDTLEGDLTIKGVTKPVTFELEFDGVSADPWGGTRAGFEATTEINRKDFGLTWNVAVEGGGVLVSEKVKINLDIQLVKA